MSWKAKITAIQDPPMPNDTVDVGISFTEDGTGREISKVYNLTAGAFKTIDDVQKLIDDDIARLDSFDSFKTLVSPLIGKIDAQAEIEKIKNPLAK